MSKKVVIISGPTASGKTAYAIELAKKIDGEIINADSMQIYSGLDIGTAKVTFAEMEGVPHHLLDIRTPAVAYSVAEFQKDARVLIDAITARGKVPMLVGGTGLYIQATVFDYHFTERPALDFTRYEALSMDALFVRLQEVDPASAATIEKQNMRRVMYAVALAEQTEQTKSEQLAEQEQKLLYDIYPIALQPERSALYERINLRTDMMFAGGLLDEVIFFSKKYVLAPQIRQAIGYKEPLAYLENRAIGLETIIEQTKQDTRRFAKRQITWLKNQKITYNYLTDETKETLEFGLMKFLGK